MSDVYEAAADSEPNDPESPNRAARRPMKSLPFARHKAKRTSLVSTVSLARTLQFCEPVTNRRGNVNLTTDGDNVTIVATRREFAHSRSLHYMRAEFNMRLNYRQTKSMSKCI